MLDENRLTRPNFFYWLRNLRIVLNLERTGYILDSKIPSALPPKATEAEHDTLRKWHKDDMQAKCYMLASMTNQLQKQHEKMQTSSEILSHLQELFSENSRLARYKISKQLFKMKIHEGQDVGEHVQTMIRLIEQLEALDFSMDFSLQTNLILQSLSESFRSFITNFHITKQECTLAGLLNILTKKKKKSNKKKPSPIPGPSSRVGKKSQTVKKKAEADPADKGKCFHCQKDGH
ncbi:uncharacterized protein LOC131174602 [Hevea brasiliensis]|uniref:uncharacterized protein LOC131174602 n=1 Tax=Hevea brasiliensis TaxID=3981 RepID=UPI0025CCD3BA|nr:uncharacterized protein LOC131174602 [Hevea brasiliensis]